MAEPHVAGVHPARLELEPGTYWWCACGLSKNQPWCDGAHKAEGIFTPIEFTVKEPGVYKLCTCKHSATKPLCDGAHKRFHTQPPPA